MNIGQIIDSIYPLPDKSKQVLEESFVEVQFAKGHILLRANKIEENIYFIKKGIARAYAHSADSEITFWFGKEGDTILSMKSYVQKQKGYKKIKLLEV